MGAFPPTAAGKNITHVCSPPYTSACGMCPRLRRSRGAARGRRQGARGPLLLPCSLPRAELPQAVALPPQPLPFPSHPRAACRGMGAREEHAAALRHWEAGGHGMGAARMCCGARASPVTAAFRSLPCRGCEPLLLLFTHVSQSQPGTLGQGEQMHRGSLGRALHIFPMAIHIQYVSGRQHG